MEKNRHILENALQELPQHEPPVFVWDSIVERLQVQNAVQQLPQYEPPTALWDSITADLAQAENDAILQETISELSTYEPPALVWNEIEQELRPQAKVVRMKWMRYAAAAAMVGLLFVAGVFYQQRDPVAIVSVEKTTEVRDVAALEADWYDDEDAFTTILAFCKTQTFTCEEPLFIDLKSDLEELNSAREELEEVMGDFGQDANLMKQLARIEHQRSDVLKEMVKLI
ncbi:MAG: hypothetical protein AB8G22_11505 [Saprospiraceae bacterium]